MMEDTVSVAVEAGRNVLAEVKDAQARLPTAEEAPSDAALGAAKAEFGALKRVFLESETRQGFMASLASADAFGILTEPPENTDESVAAAKRHNRGLKAERQELTAEIKAHVAKLDELHKVIEPKAAGLEAAVGELESEEAALKAAVEATPAVTLHVNGLPLVCKDAAAVDAAVAAQTEAAAAAASDIEALKAEEATLEQEVGPLSATLASLERRAQAVAAEAEARQARAVSERESLTSMKEWYASMSDALAALGGIAVKGIADEALTLTILPSEGREMAAVFADTSLTGLPAAGAHDLTVQLRMDEDGSCVPEGAVLTPADAPIDDIVAAARRSRDVRFLVREVASRVQCYAARQAHLEILRRRYTTSYSPLAATITYSLPAGVAVTVRLSHDYPKPSAGLHVERLDGVGGWRAPALEQVRREVNRTHVSSAIALADTLQARFAAMEKARKGFVGGEAKAMGKILGIAPPRV